MAGARVIVAGYVAVCEECPWTGIARIAQARARVDAVRHNTEKHGWRVLAQRGVMAQVDG